MMQQTNLRILIIDDNVDIHNDFIKILTSNSPKNSNLNDLNRQLFGENEEVEESLLPEFQIDTASQGQEGVEKIEEALKTGNPYALAFVDIRMPPGWDGIQTIKEIWKLDSDIQIVICTAYSDYSWEETIKQLGQKENLLILKKPFDHVAVRQLSCALTKRWKSSQQAQENKQFLEKCVKESTDSLQQSLSVTRGTLESSTDGIFIINTLNNVIDYNHKFIEMWRIPPDFNKQNAKMLFEFISLEMVSPDDFLKIVKEISNQPDPMTIDKLICKDSRIVELHSLPYKLTNEANGRIWSFRDITKRAMLEQKIEYQATYDSLTELPNRALLMDRTHQAITSSKRSKKMFGIVFFDLDRFKLINDSYSHSAGDELLKAVANRLKVLLREVDTLARLGGDEFVGVFTSLEDKNSLKQIVNKLLAAFKKPFKITGREICISTSMGIAIFPKDGENVDDLLRNADTAMYRSKELGGNQSHFYTTALSNQSLVRLEIESDLRKGIENDEFFLVYQPQYELSSNKMVSVETLIRWQHPKKGLVLPIDFIPIAEETGLIIEIGEWLLRTACKQNKYWQDIGLPPIRIAVNITTKELKQPNLVTLIKLILKESNLKPEFLELELTENVIINNLDTMHKISELKDMGINIALDDFGTGYSSINYLRKLPLDRLKIDQSFIRNISLNSGDEVIIQAIMSMAQSFHLETLAEGVETKNQLDFLKGKKCSEAQGFYLSEPLSAKNLEDLLKNPQQVNETMKEGA